MINPNRKYMMQHTGQVTAVIAEWLAAEIAEAQHGRNGYLHDFSVNRPLMQLPYDDSRNVFAQKNRSHYGRFPFFLEGFREGQDSDYAAGRVAFAGLMFASGGYRWECVASARDEEEYLHLRTSAVTSADIAQEVAGAYQARPARQQTPGQRMAKFAVYANGVNDEVADLHHGVIDWANANGLPAGKDSAPIAGLRQVQAMGIRLAASQIGLVAELWGGIEDVPLLEPKSITDAEVYYPFRSE